MLNNYELDNIKTICERKCFTNFWECLDYMLLANYEEIDSIMTSLQLFNGNIWNGVIKAGLAKISSGGLDFISISGLSLDFYGAGGESEREYEPDDLFVEIFVLTDKANELYKSMYKSYIETRKYERISELETHIKSFTIKLTTNLGIRMFKDGYKNY